MYVFQMILTVIKARELHEEKQEKDEYVFSNLKLSG